MISLSSAKRYLMRLSNTGLHPELERVQTVLAWLKNPHTQFKAIHVGGTNGKGSVCASLESILRSSGIKTGLYTSPHLVDLSERISINGQAIGQNQLLQKIDQLKKLLDRKKFELGYFEFLTVLAFLFFAEHRVDCAVVEVGLGGRWDATNVLPKPELAIITNISLEHTELLGKTVRAIAKEKAGIIKHGGAVLTGAQGAAFKVIEQFCKDRHAHLLNFKIPQKILDHQRRKFALKGSHQKQNLKLVLQAVHQLRNSGFKISENALNQGLHQVVWPGRYQHFIQDPHIILDGAHNPAAFKELILSLKKDGRLSDPCVLIFNAFKDKDLSKIFKQIQHLHLKEVWLVQMQSNRAQNLQDLAKLFKHHGLQTRSFESTQQAVENISSLQGWKGFVLVAGSLHLAGEFLQAHQKQKANLNVSETMNLKR